MFTLKKYFLIWNLIGEIFIFYRMYSVQYKILNKSSLTFCFGIRSYLFFERKIHHYALSVIKKKIHCCISLLNVHLRFTFWKQFNCTSTYTADSVGRAWTQNLFGLWSNNKNHDEPIINHVLLIFKLNVYNSREKHCLNNGFICRLKRNKKERIPFIFQQ